MLVRRGLPLRHAPRLKVVTTRQYAIRDEYVPVKKPPGAETPLKDPLGIKSEALLKQEEEIRKAKEEARRYKQHLQEIKRERRQQMNEGGALPEPPEEALMVPFKIPRQPKNPMVLNVAVIGAPNAGKSTLVNRIVGSHISAVSTKSQTTRENVIGIASIDSTQLIFTDTPGLVDKEKSKRVPRDVIIAGWDAIRRVDLIMLVVDCVKTIDSHALYIFRKLAKLQEEDSELPPAILVLNKVDLYEKIDPERRKPVLQRFERHIPNISQIFTNVFAISALTGFRVKQLEDFLKESAKPGLWLYPSDMKSLQSDVDIAIETIREKIYKRLNQETPYMVRLQIVGWKINPDRSLQIHCNILVPRAAYLKQVMGTNASNLYAIMMDSKTDLEAQFQRRVILQLFVKIKKDLENIPDIEL